MAHSDCSAFGRSPSAMFPTKSSATESTCMDKSPLSLSMSASFSHSEGPTPVTDKQSRMPSEETASSPRFSVSKLPEPVARGRRLREPVTLQSRLSGMAAARDGTHACPDTPSSLSEEAAGGNPDSYGQLAQGLISEPAPAGQIPRPSLSLIESDLEKLYAAARAPHAWNYPYPGQKRMRDLRNLACQDDDREAACISAMEHCPYCRHLPEIPAEAPAARAGLQHPAAYNEDSRSFSFSDAGQDLSLRTSWRSLSSLQPEQGSLPCMVQTSTASHRRQQSTRNVEQLPQPPRSARRSSEVQARASLGSRASSQRSIRTASSRQSRQYAPERLRGDREPPQQSLEYQQSRASSCQARAEPHAAPPHRSVDRRRAESIPEVTKIVEKAPRAAARADRPSQASLDPKEASRDIHGRLPPPPERWLEAQSFAEPGRQLRRLARQRRALAGELRARLHHMEQHCGLLSEDYRRLAGLDTELHRAVATLQKAFATEHEALALSVSSRDSQLAIG
ncbi:unnamed protein product [Symbiodinium natans]|uniref:Uncharacterized protein n=1 Tax=Symbiodinium natans TaxID=878477 RepID=A0A812MUH8_9DINO|nr:unnamed protein product [Symbiodinium natans]